AGWQARAVGAGQGVETCLAAQRSTATLQRDPGGTAEFDTHIPTPPVAAGLIDQQVGNHLPRLVLDRTGIGAGRSLPGIAVLKRVEMRALSGGRIGALFHPEALQRTVRIDLPIETQTGLQRQPYRFVAQILN